MTKLHYTGDLDYLQYVGKVISRILDETDDAFEKAVSKATALKASYFLNNDELITLMVYENGKGIHVYMIQQQSITEKTHPDEELRKKLVAKKIKELQD